MNGIDRKRLNLYLAVFAVLLVVLVVRYRNFFGGDAAAGATSAEGIPTLDARLNQMKGLPAVPLSRGDEGEGYTPKRNLFDFGQSPEVLAAEKAREEARVRMEKERVKQQEVARQEAVKHANDPPPPPPPPPPPVPPQFNYSYVAYVQEMNPPQRYMAVLQSRGGKPEPLFVREGETISSAFVVKKIDMDAVVLTYTDQRFAGQTQTVKIIPSVAGRK